jgi:hypothetical protein
MFTIRFRFASRKSLLTIMLWPGTLGVTLFDMNQQEICRNTLGWIIPPSPEEAFAFVQQQAEQLLRQAGIRKDDLYGVSLSASSTPIEIRYDNRHLPMPDARGGAIALLDHFFEDPDLYSDEKG